MICYRSLNSIPVVTCGLERREPCFFLSRSRHEFIRLTRSRSPVQGVLPKCPNGFMVSEADS